LFLLTLRILQNILNAGVTRDYTRQTRDSEYPPNLAAYIYGVNLAAQLAKLPVPPYQYADARAIHEFDAGKVKNQISRLAARESLFYFLPYAQRRMVVDLAYGRGYQIPIPF